MTLGSLRPGDRARVLSIGTQGALRRRILDMGITPRVVVQLIKVAPLGDPLELTVRGYQLSLRKQEASLIEVEII
ncbi:ferrous iron transport protein A [Sphaerochaeta sp. S2]|uniref:FeoA family protein n=1 Tax=Sphaerochaeta sp. S2 TaxID=2798868 RepID=UPI0018E9B4E7|nr:ferrous iron transport protein A [Sphaerochaeta sp. S2]MCK9348121.1 ferrous iron transport protein A [Sphaerochaeta sp.]MDC7231230.1 ferrous iron transport protein A [Sphaerochaetaceae bacterium]MBJ2356059.1 ferrous iron transport protein A [Sphaerochaeta sp. S2]MDD4301679.1 ferrous iron transport protein A [Sphaerochaeta sp.]MDD4647273.1 ferrous iron transport protein A [Sphaerochaeta sp.]